MQVAEASPGSPRAKRTGCAAMSRKRSHEMLQRHRELFLAAPVAIPAPSSRRLNGCGTWSRLAGFGFPGSQRRLRLLATSRHAADHYGRSSCARC